MRLFLPQFLMIVSALSASAQSRVIEVRGSGEHLAGVDASPDHAERLAFAAASRNALREAALQLQNEAEIKTLRLRENQLNAFLPTIGRAEEISSSSVKVTNGTLYRVTVQVRLDVPRVARRLDQLRKDPNAAAGLLQAWKQREAAHQQSALPAADSRSQQQLLALLNTAHLVAHVHAALARTEESPASVRVPSEKGRQRAWQLGELAVAMAPDSADAHLALGDVMMAADLSSAAEEQYRRALDLNPGSSDARIKVAEILRLDGRLPEALAELREVLRIEPRSTAAHADIGFILEAQQDRAGAITEYQEALRLDPDFVDGHNLLAVAFARQGKFEEAVGEFREMVRIDPESVLGYYNLGIALADLDKDDESAEAFRHAVRVNPNHFNSRFNLGELFRLEGKFDDAVKQFREYLRLAPDTPQNQRNIRRAREFVETHQNL